MTKVFISYSWEDDKHKEWVRLLTDQLCESGMDVILDQYHLSLGDRLPHFMEKSVGDADYVLIICTPTYKQKSDDRLGGVGYEGHIISGELFTKGNDRKFIPVIRKGDVSEVLPASLVGKLAIDLKDGSHYDTNFNDLVTTLKGWSKKSLVKRFTASTNLSSKMKNTVIENEPIRILGIVTDKVTVPRMDGTRGSALYKIPFRLTKHPSSLWIDLFVETWNMPPRCSTMHRPGIASVSGDEILLDGTTIEEVRDYHREVLLLCVDVANKKEAEIIAAEQRKKEKEEELKRTHYTTVNDIAGKIPF